VTRPCDHCCGLPWRRPHNNPCECGEAHAAEVVEIPIRTIGSLASMITPRRCPRCRKSTDSWATVEGELYCSRCAGEMVGKCASCGQRHVLHGAATCRACAPESIPGARPKAQCIDCGCPISGTKGASRCLTCAGKARRVPVVHCADCGVALWSGAGRTGNVRCSRCDAASRAAAKRRGKGAA
jgi:hypothetical protein